MMIFLVLLLLVGCVLFFGYSTQRKNHMLREQKDQIDKSQEAIAIAEARYRTIFEESLDGICILDTATQKIVDFNTMACDMYGYTAKEFKQLKLSDLEVGRDDDTIQTAQEEVIKRGWIQFGSRHKGKDGVLYDVIVSMKPITIDKISYLYATIHNVTNQKILEDELTVEKERAVHASRVKSEFLANMSHEIRTPLNGIIGLTNLVLEGDLEPRQRDYLRKSISSSTTLLGIINDILDYSKLEVKQMKLEAIPFELDALMYQLSNLFCYQVDREKIHINCGIYPWIHNNLIGDPLRISQILVNLIGNAVKFTQKGQIGVKVEHIKEHKEQLTLLFTISDTGIGFSSKHKERLFRSFSQVDTSNTREFGGSGLGLAISQELAVLMGGEITVQSVEGVGSTFSFSITVGFDRDKQETITQKLKNQKVLVVNYLDFTGEILERNLHSFSCESTFCSNMEDTIKELRENDFDYILADWELPTLGGVEFISSIENLKLDKQPIIILMAAHASLQELQEVAREKQVQLNRILLKPYTTASLFDILMRDNPVIAVSPHKNFHLQGSVLLVEDNEINQIVAKQNLENFGLLVATALDGVEALDMARKKKYDLIFMDLQMPNMDGYEATKHIREFDTVTPIIALSAAVMRNDILLTKKAGMNEHLAKPLDTNRLKIVLSKYLQAKERSEERGECVAERLSILGVDTEELLERFGDNSILAKQSLLQFATGEKDLQEQLETLEIGSDAFNRVIHTLKGLSGNLALKDLYRLSSQIYQSENQESTDSLLRELIESLGYVTRNIQESIGREEEKEMLACEKYKTEEVDKMIEYANRDFVTGSYISSNRATKLVEYTKSTLGEKDAEELSRSLLEFDYATATKILNKTKGVPNE